jgi:cardiolipin synthase
MLTKIPNMLTMGRIAVIPVMIATLIGLDAPLGNWVAFTFYTFACLTDFFDGYLARAFAQQSAFGRFLDPIADKLLVASVLLLLIGVGRIQDTLVIPAAVILCREILVSGLREYLAEVRVPMPVTALAKWKTVLQMLALGFLLVGPAGPDFGPLTTTEIGVYGLWGAALLTIITGADYLIVGIRQIVAVDKREGQEKRDKKVTSKPNSDIPTAS